MTNQDPYTEAMAEGTEHAWAARWLPAAEAYRRAIRSRPNDLAARTNLGVALLHANRHAEALEVYLRLEELSPGNPATLNKVVELYAALGNHVAAASTCVLLGDGFVAKRQAREAVQAWQRALRFDPRSKAALRRLAEAYRRGNRLEVAAGVLAALAQIHADEGNLRHAVAACEQALDLVAGFAPAAALLESLRAPARQARRGEGTVANGAVAPVVDGTGRLVLVLEEASVAATHAAPFGGHGAGVMNVANLAEEVPDERVGAAIAASQVYEERGFLASAVEECYWALGFAPQYLPLHLRLASLLDAAGQPAEAAAKRTLVAELYLARGDRPRAERLAAEVTIVSATGEARDAPFSIKDSDRSRALPVIAMKNGLDSPA
ncbi:MAG TPA: tetratricopeptide repeat protein [Ardenticatenaceae bacterium]|nr:tetratricopeptide repeat protein [Ardenticatenaceae bacterium]